MSWYEKLDFLDFDVNKIREQLYNEIMPLGEQIIQGEEYETPAYHGFGGWSVTSRTGDWRDGWDYFQNDEGKELELFFPKNQNNYKTLKFFGISMSTEHKNPTQACTGEIAKVVEQIESLGLTPRRVRITCLKAGAKSLVHKDSDENEYMARLHIPIVTNPKCVFLCEGETLHMEAGNAYMVWVNTWHQIRNDSNEDRYHIIMDAYDTKFVTKNFHYKANIQELFDHHERVRKEIDNAEITPEEYEQFEALRQKFVTKPKHENKNV